MPRMPSTEARIQDSIRNWTTQYMDIRSGAPSDIILLLELFAKEQNLPYINEWSKFVTTNFSTLTKELDVFGLSKTNPFILFLNNYYMVNKNITPFLDKDKYNILHNCLSNNILSDKQVAFTCPENEQVRILVNKNLWSQKYSDIKWLIKLWVELGDDRYYTILNKDVLEFFKDDIKRRDFLSLQKAVMFTSQIKRFKEKEKDPTIKLLSKSTIDNISAITDNFESLELIDEQVGLLSQDTQESPRGVKGQYQHTDTDPNIKKAKEEPIDVEQANKTVDKLYVDRKDFNDILTKLKKLPKNEINNFIRFMKELSNR